MDSLSLQTLADYCDGTLSGGMSDVLVSQISKDTRTLKERDAYLALRGENFDGKSFTAEAIRRGASVVILDGEIPTGLASEVPVIQVDNAEAALHRLAGNWRDELDLKVVGITGSSGKTSTKELTAAVLGARYQVTKTAGNLNNHIGLPLTILNASRFDQMAVWEMGMSHPGEIAPLAKLAKPHLGIISSIGVAHIEFFKTQDRIANEKADLLRALDASGTAIIPSGDAFADYLADQTDARVVRAGIGHGDIVALDIHLDATGSRFTVTGYGSSTVVQLPVPGEHMIRNAMLAIAAGVESGLALDECAEGLACAQITSGRLQQMLIRGVRVIDDTYNANPDSMEAALATIATAKVEGRPIAVLGKMGELGQYSETGYRRVAVAAAKYAKILITVGDETDLLAREARKAGCKNVTETRDALEAARLLKSLAKPGDIVLVKGSRSARMEQVIGGFKN